MQTANPELTAVALDHLMRFLLTRCRYASLRAALLLECLAAKPGTDLSTASQRLSERLQDGVVQVRVALPMRGYDGWRHEHV